MALDESSLVFAPSISPELSDNTVRFVVTFPPIVLKHLGPRLLRIQQQHLHQQVLHPGSKSEKIHTKHILDSVRRLKK